MLTEYETTVVVRPDIGGDAIEATLDRLREAVRRKNGKLLAINHWGKKRLSYPIEKQTRGIYVHTQYLGEGDLVAEVERNLRIADTVLRFLTIKVATGVDASSYEEKEYVRPQYDAEETAGGEGAEAGAQPARAEGEAAGEQQAKPAGEQQAKPEGEQQAKPEGEQQAKPEGEQQAKPEGEQQAKPEGEQQAEAGKEQE